MIKRKYRTENSRPTTIVMRYNFWFLLGSFILCLYSFSSFAVPVNTVKTDLEQSGIKNHSNQVTDNESENSDSNTSILNDNIKIQNKRKSLKQTIKIGLDYIIHMPSSEDPKLTEAKKHIKLLKTKRKEWKKEFENVNKLINEKTKSTDKQDTRALFNLADTIAADIAKLQNDVSLLKTKKDDLKDIINHKLDKLVVSEEIEVNEGKKQELQIKFKSLSDTELNTSERVIIQGLQNKTWEEFNKVVAPYKGTYAYSEKILINRELRANLLYLAKVGMNKAIEQLGEKLTEDEKMDLDNKVKSLVEEEILRFDRLVLKETLHQKNKELTDVITEKSKTCDFS